MTRETCATCRFWSFDYCRRLPPLSTVSGLPKWPRTIAEDWCGEHRPAAPAEDDAYTRAAVRYAEAEMRLKRVNEEYDAVTELPPEEWDRRGFEALGEASHQAAIECEAAEVALYALYRERHDAG